jgi:hypothetical protein
VFTDLAETLAALRAAARLAVDLRSHIFLVVPQVVPYPAPIEAPPISTAFPVRHFRTVADDLPIDLHVRVYICRNRRTVLAAALRPRSLIVIAGRRSWWPTRKQRLAAELARLGHDVFAHRNKEADAGPRVRFDHTSVLRRLLGSRPRV